MSFGFRTESALMPTKPVPINQVDRSSVLELKAMVFNKEHELKNDGSGRFMRNKQRLKAKRAAKEAKNTPKILSEEAKKLKHGLGKLHEKARLYEQLQQGDLAASENVLVNFVDKEIEDKKEPQSNINQLLKPVGEFGSKKLNNVDEFGRDLREGSGHYGPPIHNGNGDTEAYQTSHKSKSGLGYSNENKREAEQQKALYDTGIRQMFQKKRRSEMNQEVIDSVLREAERDKFRKQHHEKVISRKRSRLQSSNKSEHDLKAESMMLELMFGGPPMKQSQEYQQTPPLQYQQQQQQQVQHSQQQSQSHFNSNSPQPPPLPLEPSVIGNFSSTSSRRRRRRSQHDRDNHASNTATDDMMSDLLKKMTSKDGTEDGEQKARESNSRKWHAASRKYGAVARPSNMR